MVKGISRQVIVVHAPDPKLFEQAIFIIKEGASGVTDEALLKEAEKAVQEIRPHGKKHFILFGAFWSVCGAAFMGLIWLGTVVI